MYPARRPARQGLEVQELAPAVHGEVSPPSSVPGVHSFCDPSGQSWPLFPAFDLVSRKNTSSFGTQVEHSARGSCAS